MVQMRCSVSESATPAVVREFPHPLGRRTAPLHTFGQQDQLKTNDLQVGHGPAITGETAELDLCPLGKAQFPALEVDPETTTVA